MATPIGFEPTISAVTGRHVHRYTTGPLPTAVTIVPNAESFVNPRVRQASNQRFVSHVLYYNITPQIVKQAF